MKKFSVRRRIGNATAGNIKESGIKAFKQQCVPTTSELLTIENYKKFIAARRILIAKRLNEFLSPPI